MKLGIWFFAAAAILVLLCCSPAVAETSGDCGTNVTWMLNGDTLTISGTGAMVDFDYSHKPGWYEQRETVKKIVITGGVTGIGNDSFRGCSGLTDVTIPDSVKRIGSYAFEDCSVLEYVSIPDGVTTIQDHAFAGCAGLTTMYIPAGVTLIEHSVFYRCASLYAIYVSSDNPNYSAAGGALLSKDGSVLLVCPGGKTGIYTTPVGVTIIKDGAFASCGGLNGISVRDGVTAINGYAFSGCTSMTEIELPDSVTYINDFAFWDCSSRMTFACNGGSFAAQWALSHSYSVRLLDMTIQDGVLTRYHFAGYADAVIIPAELGVTAVGDYAFEGADVRVLELPLGVVSIGSGAFRSTSLEQVSLPDGLTNLGNSVFMGCINLKSANIPEGVTAIEFMTFYNCAALQSITIADSVTSIADDAFVGCKALTTVYCRTGNSYAAVWARNKGYTVIASDHLDASGFILPAWLYEIEEEAFAGLPMSGVTCCSGLSSIGSRAFADCANLRVIVIPSSVCEIAGNAFAGCPGGLVIIGAEDSTAAEFAHSHGYTFISR